MNDNLNVLIGKRLKILRTNSKLSQQTLSTMLGLSRSMYAQFERGESLVPVSLLIKVSKLNDISIDSILNFKDVIYFYDMNEDTILLNKIKQLILKN